MGGRCGLGMKVGGMGWILGWGEIVCLLLYGCSRLGLGFNDMGHVVISIMLIYDQVYIGELSFSSYGFIAIECGYGTPTNTIMFQPQRGPDRYSLPSLYEC